MASTNVPKDQNRNIKQQLVGMRVNLSRLVGNESPSFPSSQVEQLLQEPDIQVKIATTSWLCFWADGPSTVVVCAHDVDEKLLTAFSDVLDTVRLNHIAQQGVQKKQSATKDLPGYGCRKGISGG